MRRSLISIPLAGLMLLIWPATAFAATDPGLGTAGNYAVLAAATITNTGPSWITGKLALSPGTSVVGLGSGGPGTVGVQDITNAAAGQARTDAGNAYTNARGQATTQTLTGTDLGTLGPTGLGPGVYFFASSAGLTGSLILNGGGIYIFNIGSTLTTASSSRVVLTNGAQPCDVFWTVGSSATIGGSTAFVGTILANTSITMVRAATLNGRALAGVITSSGALTLDTNRIIQPSGCPGGFTASYPTPTYVPPPANNILPATLGVPWDLGSTSWLLVMAVGAGLGATALVVSNRRRRRRTS